MIADRGVQRVRQGVQALAGYDALRLMAPDDADEVVDLVLGAWGAVTGIPLVDRLSAARVAQRLLARLGQDHEQDAYMPEDICWQIGLMQDYELRANGIDDAA